VSFTRGDSGRGGAVRQRGRGRILEMSGWLFADMLLALAVVFLVVQDTTGPDLAASQAGSAPNVEIRPSSDSRFDVKDREFRWSSDQGPAVIEIEFDQQVAGFEQPAAGERRGDIRFSEDTPEGWYVASLVRLQQADGMVFRAELNVPENYRPGKVSVYIRQSAALSVPGNVPNIQSPVFSFQALPRPEEQIDTKQGVVLVLNEANVCPSKPAEGTARVRRGIESAMSFEYGPPSGEERIPISGDLTNWIADEFTNNARVGFLFIYGSSDSETQRARDWKPCVTAALKELGYISSEDVPVKPLMDRVLKGNQFGLEMYFFTAGTD
jgi:hypothetical protein